MSRGSTPRSGLTSEQLDTLRTMLDAVPAAIWFKDTENNIIAVNRHAAALEDSSADELAGKSCWDLYPREQADAYFADDQEVMLSGEPKLGIVETHSAVGSGEEMWLEVSKVPVRDEIGAITGVVAMAIDITEKKRLEESVRNAQRLESLAVLAGGLAHDFNNLLAGVFGLIEQARFCPDCGPQALAKLDGADEAVERARSLTQQLLTFARGGAPKMEPLDMVDLVSAAGRFSLSGSGIAMTLTAPDDLPSCLGDRRQLLQVLDNLLINARQAMGDRGEVRITVTDAEDRDPLPDTLGAGRYLALTVEDNGPGVPENESRRIFDPFFTTKEEGTGLGLAVVWSIVKQHGGHVALSRSVEGGARFDIWLRATTELLREPASTRRQRATAPRFEGRALVMDDELVLRELVGELLTGLGFEVSTAVDGTEALRLIEEAAAEGRPFRVAVVDLTVRGGEGGLAVARKAPPVPLVAMSGYSVSDVMADPKGHGFAACLPKPFVRDDLIEAVSQALESSIRPGDDTLGGRA